MPVINTLQKLSELLLDWLDKHGQWIAIKGIYAWEWLVLPVVAFLFLLWPMNRWWRRLMYVQGVALLIYLSCFTMHRYSYLAWPLMAGTLAYFISRMDWTRVIRFRPRWRERWDQAMQFARQGKRLSKAVAAVAGIVVVIWFLRIPTESLLVLSGVLLTGGCLAWLLSRFRGGVQGLINYIRCDPRMVRYLDCVRILLAPWRTRTTSLLAENRLIGRSGSNAPLSYADAGTVRPQFGFWTVLFRMACLPGIRQLLRFLATRRCMPTLDSHFVAEQLTYQRELAWAEYERARFGETLTEYLKKTRRDDPTIVNKAHVLRPLPAELNGDDARRLRLRWLALTEALAECHSFSEPTPLNGLPQSRFVHAALWMRDRLVRAKSLLFRMLRALTNFVLHTLLGFMFGRAKATAPLAAAVPELGQPDLRLTAGLLSEAGELQHEIFRDLHRAAAAPATLVAEARLAIHFFDLSTRCLELSLEPGLRTDRTGAADLGIPERSEHFCNVLGSQEWWSTRHITDAGWSEIELRLALFWRYLLLARLLRDCDRLQNEPQPPMQAWLDGPAKNLVRQIETMRSVHPRPLAGHVQSAPGGTVAQPEDITQRASVFERAVIHATAYGSLTLNLSRGDRARVMFGHTAFLLHDGRNNRAQIDKLAYTEELLDAIKDRADSRRVSMLWGLAVEQEMDFAIAGSDVWWEHCYQAIGFYRRARSLRIWRLCAIASIPSDENGGTANAGSSTRGPDDNGGPSTAAPPARRPSGGPSGMRRAPAEIVELV